MRVVMKFQATELDEAETEVVDHLLALSAANSKTTKEFEGFDQMDENETLETPNEIEDSRVPENFTPPSAKSLVNKVKRTTAHMKESDIKFLVTQVVEQLAPTIKSFSVTEKMMKVQVCI